MKLPSLCRHRWLRRTLWTLILLLSFYILTAQWINWKGARDLKAAIAEFEAAGETLDFRALLPTPPPDRLNFCAIPALNGLADDEEGKAASERLDQLVVEKASSDSPPGLGRGALQAQPIDLGAWATHLTGVKDLDPQQAASQIQKALEPDAALIQSLIDALDRTDAAWTPTWKDCDLTENLFELTLPHYSPARHLSHTLAVLTQTEIALGHADRAHALLHVQLRLTRATLNDPILIGTLVGVTQLQMANDCVWALAAAQLGSPDQWRALETELRRIDLRSTLLMAYRVETTAATNTLMHLKSQTGGQALTLLDEASTAWGIASLSGVSFYPGFLDENAATVIRLEHQHLIRPLLDGLPIVNESAAALDTQFASSRPWMHPDRLLARMILPAVTKIAERVAAAEGTLLLATAASHLEFQFAQRGAYPESADSLPVGMHYQRTAERYRLWLPGLDGDDDGGLRVLDGTHPDKTKFHAKSYSGDWVWDYSAD